MLEKNRRAKSLLLKRVFKIYFDLLKDRNNVDVIIPLSKLLSFLNALMPLSRYFLFLLQNFRKTKENKSEVF